MEMNRDNNPPTDWNTQSLAARKHAAWAFCNMLKNDNELRSNCTKHDAAAGSLAYSALKQAGNYVNMPSSETLNVYVYEQDELDQQPDDTLVVLVLPKKLGDLSQFGLEKAWIAGWNHWMTSVVALRKLL